MPSVIEKSSKTFFLSSLFFSKSLRSKIATLYSVLRIIDDYVDHESGSKSNRVHKRESLKKLKRLIYGNFKDLKLKSELKEKFGRSLIEDLETLLKSNVKLKDKFVLFLYMQVKDINLKKVMSDNELEKYCYGVAGIVGHMFCLIEESSNSVSFKKAKDLGIAMQLTNIARDVYEDYLNDKIYLPEITKKDIEEGRVNLIQAERVRVINHSNCLYGAAIHGIKDFPLRVALAIYTASVLYQGIGFKILKNASYKKRVYLSSIEKIILWIKSIPTFIRIYYIKPVKRLFSAQETV